MIADVLATQWARASTTMMLILLNRDNSVPARLLFAVLPMWLTNVYYRTYKSPRMFHSSTFHTFALIQRSLWAIIFALWDFLQKHHYIRWAQVMKLHVTGQLISNLFSKTSRDEKHDNNKCKTYKDLQCNCKKILIYFDKALSNLLIVKLF